MIIWDEKYTTGDEDIDRQHMTLFKFCNDFEESLQQGNGMSFMMGGLQFIEDYAQAHFHFEEDCMTKRQCPFAQKNKVAHDKFLEYFMDFKNRLQSTGYSEELVVELHQTMERWLTNHIIGIDTHLKDCIKKNSI